MNEEQVRRLIGYFIEEAKDHLATIEINLTNFSATLEAPEKINAVFLAARAIAGGAAILGFSSVQKTALSIKDCFRSLQEHPIAADEQLKTQLLKLLFCLKEMMVHLSQSWDLETEVLQKIIPVVETAAAELNERLSFLIYTAELRTVDLEAIATNETNRLYLSGRSTVKTILQAIGQVGGKITRRRWQHKNEYELNLEIEVRVPEPWPLDVIPQAFQALGGNINQCQIETLRTCKQCCYYHGQHDIVCALHPRGAAEQMCRDWTPVRDK